MLKVMTIVGTRPEIIRLSRVIARLDEAVDHVLVHTGQNYDYTLNGIFFDEMDIRRPDHFLEVDTSSLGRVLGETLIKTEQVLQEERPDAVLVLGDTNSCIASVIAKRMRIPVFHMEAGNRCFDDRVPEETNRRLVDHVSDYNLAYTEHARRNLLAEGVHPSTILVTGSPMAEVLNHYRAQIDASGALAAQGLTSGEYFLVSAHREETVDSPDRLRSLLDSLLAVHHEWSLPVVVSTHPRTRKRLEALPGWSPTEGLIFHEPFGFCDYNKLQIESKCVLSDSGTISEESAILDFPAVTLRDSIERPEGLDAAVLPLTGIDPARVVHAVEWAASGRLERVVPPEYQTTNTSSRVVNFVLSNTRSAL